jgi:NMD protein affecting ribosome stability and mRNA decay
METMPTARGTHPSSAAKNKGLIRSLNRTGVRVKKVRAGEAASGRLPEPSACERCGAIFSRRVWRRPRKVTAALLERAHWMTCPGCEQAKAGTGFGRILVRGRYAAAHDAAIRRRIANTTARAAETQPERQLSSVERRDDVLEILTTSQKLAHRIVRELKKAFGGHGSFAWSDDGTLFATWQR